MILKDILVVIGVGAAAFTSSEPRLVPPHEILPLGDSGEPKTLYCRPTALLNAERTGRACGIEPTSFVQRMQALQWQENHAGGRVSDPGLGDYVEALFPDIPIEEDHP